MIYKKIIFLVLLSLYTTYSFGQEKHHFVSIDTLLKPHWEITLEDWDAYDGKPLIKNGILFPYHSERFAIDIKTGERLDTRKEKTKKLFQELFSDSLLLRDNYDQVSITNIHTDSIVFSVPRKGPAYYGYVSPELIGGGTVYVAKDKNTISAINLLDKSVIWEFLCEEKICAKPKITESNVMFCDKNSLYVVDKNSGTLIKRKKFEGRIVSDIEINERMLYLWVKGEGLYAVDPKTLETVWNYNDLTHQFGNYRLIFEHDTLFFASWNLFALNKLSGKLIWRSDYSEISLVHNVALIDNFILYYDSGSDGVVSFITAAGKDNGERKFYGFTSDSFPPDIPDDPKNLSGIEYEELAFPDEVHNGIIIGVSRNKIYAFTLR